jgi:hypothetical protein
MNLDFLKRRALMLISCAPILAAPTAAMAGTSVVEEMGASTAELAVDQKGTFTPNPVSPRGRLSPMSSTVPDVHGTFAVENFNGCASNLGNTHESAAGFRNYLANWYAPNFIYQDGGVGTWAFHDDASGNFDLWTSGTVDYGIDAVLAMWQSSHGYMDSGGTYYTWMGTDWAGQGCYARSNRMALGGNHNSFGDERGRYFFWDTCTSLRYGGGINPMNTWGSPARGVRMVFGYETISIDSPNYGGFFWEEWNKGKSLSTAFLDASWRIYTPQSPVAMAFGSTQAEATSRLDNERNMEWGAVSNSWGAWRWYYASSIAGMTRDAVVTPPAQVRSYTLDSGSNSDSEVLALAARLGLPTLDSKAIEARGFGIRVLRTNALTLAVEADGDYELFIDRPASASRVDPLSNEALIEKARELTQAYRLGNSQELAVGVVRELVESTGTLKDLQKPHVLEKTVVLDQVVDGLPFIDADSGHVELTFDAASGELKRFKSTLRTLEPRSALETQSRTLEDVRKAAEAAITVPSARLVEGTEKIGLYTLDGKVSAVYQALAQDPTTPEARPQLIVIPLAE